VRHHADVFIAGGGPAGMAAAVTAARQGCRVFLAEGHTCFGGMATAGMLPVICQFTDGMNFVSAPFGEEVYDRLFDAGGCGPVAERGLPPEFQIINGEVLKRVYDDMATGADFDFSFQTQCISVLYEGPTITHAICHAKSGMFAIKADVFIDCTGDGDLANWVSAPFEKGDANGAMQPGTLCSLWAGVNWQKAFASGIPQGSRLEQAFKDGCFTVDDRHMPGIHYNGMDWGIGNLGHAFGLDGTDERSLTNALLESRKVVLEYESYFKKYLEGFEEMELVSTASLMGVRETRRILGDYVLNLDDFKKRAIFPDEIGRYSYRVDMHAVKADPAGYKEYDDDYNTYLYNPGESYGIPYRILTPLGMDNLLVAGRCVSCDRYIHGSIRVTPGCYITGQAAGMAAVVAAEQRVSTRGIDVLDLQHRLKKIGAYLPNCAMRSS